MFSSIPADSPVLSLMKKIFHCNLFLIQLEKYIYNKNSLNNKKKEKEKTKKGGESMMRQP